VFEGLRYLVSLDRPVVEILRDLFDLVVVAFIVYRALLVLKGTRAMQMGLGFVAFGVLYLLAKYAQLATLLSVLSWLASSFILIVVVVFQNDIRRALMRVGAKAWLGRGRDAQQRVIKAVVDAATVLARHRMGALIVLERDANVLEFASKEGTEIDSAVSSSLLVALFVPEAENELHDGAVVIRDLRIARAGVYLPMADSARITDPSFGTRHNAAIGITEETDAVVVVVSEERGTITLVFKDGTLVPNLTGEALMTALTGLFGRTEHKGPKSQVAVRGSASSVQPMSSKGDRAATDKPKGDKVKTDKPPVAASPSAVRSGKPPAVQASASSSSKQPAIKPTKQSGRFPALSPEGDVEKTGSPPRVSIPMPAPTERKPESIPPPTDPTATPAPPSVSKPMTPADLPGTILRSNDDT
jgi:uncharacterized protein (TIGR00159 family)